MSDKRRRKSLSIFGPSLSALTTVHPEPTQLHAQLKKKARPTSILSSFSHPASPSSPGPDITEFEKADRAESPKTRPRTLQKGNRNSVLGSLRSLRSLDDEERPGKSDSKASSTCDDEEVHNGTRGLFGSTVLHHGEVQSMGSVFRKKSQYLVLTETHLIRFKGQGKAAEMFPTIPATLSRSNTNRQSMVSVASFHDVQTAAYSDITSGIALNQIIATYRLDDGKPYFSVEVAHLDDRSKRTSSMHLQLSEPREAENWLNDIRSAARKARAKHGFEYGRGTLDYVARVLERDRDYDPDRFRIFKVVQRASNKAIGRSSSDDLAKISSTVCYFVIGSNKVHLVPLQKPPTRASTSYLNDFDVPSSFGLMTLTSLSLQPAEDSFQLVFRAPLRTPFAIHLASSAASEIALWVRNAAEYLRPEWLRQPFVFNVPRGLEDQMDPPQYVEEDHKCFDRTLIAYCAAYEIDTSRICYTIDYNCEDAPCFKLLPSIRSNYSALELLAVLRALRYNESFTSISLLELVLTLCILFTIRTT